MTDKMDILNEFQKHAGIKFKNISLLKQALTHSSFAKKVRSKGVQDNERLEFFGDAVLKLIVSEYLFQTYPNLSEGPLTKKRAQIVSDKFLSEAAVRINLGAALFLSESEKVSGGASRSSILANAFEALLGAYYLDSGYDAAKVFFLTHFQAVSIEGGIDLKDYKTALQEYLQKKNLDLPNYQLIDTEGPEHQKIFHVEGGIKVDKKTLKRKGKGNSKKEAEQQAAKRLLELLDKR